MSEKFIGRFNQPIEETFKSELEQLRDFATRHEIRDDWHEPDCRDVSAVVVGDHLDNAMGSEIVPELIKTARHEFVVVLRHESGDSCTLNLAAVLALAGRGIPDANTD